jgi:chromosome segregation ATPase
MNDINMFDEIDYKEKYKKEHKRRQEAEGELAIIKATTVLNSPEMREMKTKLSETEVVLNGTKKIVREMQGENSDMFQRIAELCEVNESHQKLNGKLQTQLTELEEYNIKLRQEITVKEQEVLEVKADNLKLARQIDDHVSKLRQAGVL